MSEEGKRQQGPRMAREIALGVLCHLESYPVQERTEAFELIWENPPQGDETGEDAFVLLLGDPQAQALARSMVERLMPRWEEIDDAIRVASKRWRLERMDRVDRNILRMAAFELLVTPALPKGVIASEAVRLAARYGSERSVAFVNGVVESIAHQVRSRVSQDAPQADE